MRLVNLKCTWTISDTSLSFLGLSVSTSGNHLETDIYFKPTDSHSYLLSPTFLQDCYPLSQFLCPRRICSQDEGFHSRTSQMSSFFKDRNFPSTVENALNRISCVSCTSVLTPPPPSLCDSLVCSTLPTSPTTPGTFPCNRRRCYTCLYTSPLTSIPGPEKTFNIKQMFTCTSVNVVYCIHCSRCGLLYIRETKQRLEDHLVEHLRSARDKRQHLPVANHFNSPSHSL
eukprot:g17082.t1